MSDSTKTPEPCIFCDGSGEVEVGGCTCGCGEGAIPHERGCGYVPCGACQQGPPAEVLTAEQIVDAVIDSQRALLKRAQELRRERNEALATIENRGLRPDGSTTRERQDRKALMEHAGIEGPPDDVRFEQAVQVFLGWKRERDSARELLRQAQDAGQVSDAEATPHQIALAGVDAFNPTTAMRVDEGSATPEELAHRENLAIEFESVVAAVTPLLWRSLSKKVEQLQQELGVYKKMIEDFDKENGAVQPGFWGRYAAKVCKERDALAALLLRAKAAGQVRDLPHGSCTCPPERPDYAPTDPLCPVHGVKHTTAAAPEPSSPT